LKRRRGVKNHARVLFGTFSRAERGGGSGGRKSTREHIVKKTCSLVRPHFRNAFATCEKSSRGPRGGRGLARRLTSPFSGEERALLGI